jgi:hypothetical protein
MKQIIATVILLFSFSISAFEDIDEKLYFDLLYLESLGEITGPQVGKTLFHVELLRKMGICGPDEKCIDLTTHIQRMLDGEKSVFDETFPEIGRVERSVGRAIRRGLEDHGRRASEAARRRAERRFGGPRPRPPHDSTRIGNRFRRG